VKLTSFVCVAALSALAAGPSAAATTWDLPTAWPANNYIVKNLVKFADQVKQITNNEVVITVHPAGSLGFKGPEMFSTVRDGLVPIGDMLLSQQVGNDPRLGLESLPHLIANFEELKVFGKHYRPLLNEIYEKNNQKILFSIPWPQQQIYTKVAINSIEDMKGIKIRSYDKSSTAIFAAAGMTPVQLPWSDVLPSLAAGSIDAVATSAPSAVDGSFWELLKYGYATRQSWGTNIISVNLGAWRKLTKDQQEKIANLGVKMEPEFWASAQTVDKESAATLAGKGLISREIDEKTRKELRARAASLREASLKPMGEKAAAVIKAFENR
jgi:TRAP-type C4-dicarboxylate transport system substrate-binding protein